jgi:hypothetical protein
MAAETPSEAGWITVGHVQDAIHEDARGDDVVGVDFA